MLTGAGRWPGKVVRLAKSHTKKSTSAKKISEIIRKIRLDFDILLNLYRQQRYGNHLKIGLNIPAIV